MSSHIWIEETAYLTNTQREIARARVALRKAGLTSAPLFAGLPDGTGDTHKTSNILWAKPKGGTREGAGRPLEGEERMVTKTIRVKPSTWELLGRLADAEGVGHRELLEDALRLYESTPPDKR